MIPTEWNKEAVAQSICLYVVFEVSNPHFGLSKTILSVEWLNCCPQMRFVFNSEWFSLGTFCSAVLPLLVIVFVKLNPH